MSVNRERWLVLAATTAVVSLRSFKFLIYSHSDFDSDEAIVGLMAKHLVDGSALPVYFYGQHFMLGVEAWLTALVSVVTGPTVQGLRLVILGLNLAAALMLVVLLERDLGLRPVHAFAASLFFLIPPPGTTQLLMNGNGGNIEPLVYVLVLWTLRRRPALFGVTLAVGFLNREFTVYGLAALAAIELAGGSLLRRDSLRPLIVSAVAFVAAFQSVAVLKAFGSPAGPGTTFSSGRASNLGEVAARTCLDLAAVPSAFGQLLTSHLGTLFVGRRAGALWLVVGLSLAVALGAIAVHAWRERRWPWANDLRFGSYLLLTGAGAAVGHVVLRCGDLSRQRYSLLVLFAPVGILGLFLRLERHRSRRVLLLAVTSLWAVVSASGHVRLFADEARTPDRSEYQVLTDALVAKGIRFARANYWTAYHVTFLSREQVIVDSTDVNRVRKYRLIVDAHDGESVWIRRRPCSSGVELVPRQWYACGR